MKEFEEVLLEQPKAKNRTSEFTVRDNDVKLAYWLFRKNFRFKPKGIYLKGRSFVVSDIMFLSLSCALICVKEVTK